MKPILLRNHLVDSTDVPDSTSQDRASTPVLNEIEGEDFIDKQDVAPPFVLKSATTASNRAPEIVLRSRAKNSTNIPSLPSQDQEHSKSSLLTIGTDKADRASSKTSLDALERSWSGNPHSVQTILGGREKKQTKEVDSFTSTKTYAFND